MNRLNSLLATSVLSATVCLTGTATAQLQPIDAGDAVTLSATDNPAFTTNINGINYVVSQQTDGLYVMHGEDGSFQSYPGVDFIRNVEGRYASFGSVNGNQNGPVRLDLVTGDLFEPPAVVTTGLDGTVFRLRPALTDGVDVSGGLAFQVGNTSSSFSCPGFSESLSIPEAFGLPNISAGAAIDCDLGVVGSIVYELNSTHFQFHITRDFTDLNSVYSPLGIQVAINDIAPASRPTFMKIKQTVFDSEYSVLMQGHNEDDIAYLYNGSDASLTPMQTGERFIALVESGAVAINAAGECIFVDEDFNRTTLTSNGTPYTNCVSATQVGDQLVVAAQGSVIAYYHQLEEPVVEDPDTDDLACVDTDGDGWGWNGFASCRPPKEGDTVCIDTDGDGWGWTGTESCRIETPEPPDDIDIYENVPCIDSDGDGWGWQQPVEYPSLGRSCLMTD